jgi:hypothetical protein
MSGQEKHTAPSKRAWLSGLPVTFTTIVAYLAFWRIWPIATFLIGCAALVGLLVFFWTVGRRKCLSQGLRTDNANDTSGGV